MKAREQWSYPNNAPNAKNDKRETLVIRKSCGAEGGTRTRTDYSTRPSNVRGYQLRHLGKIIVDLGKAKYGMISLFVRNPIYLSKN